MVVWRQGPYLESLQLFGNTATDFDRESLNNDRLVYYLEYGGKYLTIDPNDGSEFTTFVQNKPNSTKVPNETGYLYRAAKKLMQKIVNQWKKTFWYDLTTENEQMADWAKTSGTEIFGWKRMKEKKVPDKKSTRYTFSTEIQPEA